MSNTRRVILIISLFLDFFLLGPYVLAGDLTCLDATTLDALVTCIRNQMPQAGSNGFVAPTATEQSDWRTVVRQMLEGACDFALPSSLSGIMQIRTFTDASDGKTYCVLMEVRDDEPIETGGDGYVDRGWGTFITNPNPTRELSHQAPHPIFDSTTENQAVAVFQATNSRSYLMCGADRRANPPPSACQPSQQFGEADCAHNVNNMFQPTQEELLAFYGAQPWTAIQWHGMSAMTCPLVNAYLSLGFNATPPEDSQISVLQSNMRLYHPDWSVQVPDSAGSPCTLNATDNVQGRLLNGVPPERVCNTRAMTPTDKFIHIEQQPGFRSASDWIPAVNDTWPEATSSQVSAAGRLFVTPRLKSWCYEDLPSNGAPTPSIGSDDLSAN